MPKPILAANWKMHKTISGGQAFVAQMVDLVPGLMRPGAGEILVLVFPGFVSLQSVATAARGTTIRVGAQDCHVEASGSFTGEVSLPQIKDAGGTAVIVGHSERRHVFEEDDEMVGAKLRAVVNAGMLAVLCVGETEEQREQEIAFETVARQIAVALKDAGEINERRLVVAYEPVWAIGTGRNATVPEVEEMAVFIRERIEEAVGGTNGREISILYGGSVKPGNLAGYVGIREIHGALVGGASLESASFAALYREMEGG
ncbi:MAG: triose-phosphate isomerase [Candidatus Riflebacteria bacterium RBG_13_59_9]|nr:MAG: triose-phosphate isomerase [Candidatus Riflebacteria bacterium RBG_13_59_9]